MRYITARDNDTHTLRQELRDLTGETTIPTDLVVAILRLSGGYSRVKGRMYVDTAEGSDNHAIFSAYWVSGSALGTVSCATPRNAATSNPTGGAGASKVTGRVVSLHTLRSIDPVETRIWADSSDPTDVGINASWTLTFHHDDSIKLPAPSDSRRADQLDVLVDAVLTHLHGEPVD